MGKLKDLTGQKFNKLTVLKRGENTPSGSIRWVCRCDCGNETLIISYHLRIGNTKSCGCDNPKNHTKHNMVDSPTYISWHSMKNRCNNANEQNYSKYGGAGITVCERWNEFINFYEDMGERPEGKTLDRIAGAKVYSKETCKWSSISTQNFNTKRKPNKLGVRGVSITLSGKYSAYITKNYKTIYLGTYCTLEEAKIARKAGEDKYYPNVELE